MEELEGAAARREGEAFLSTFSVTSLLQPTSQPGTVAITNLRHQQLVSCPCDGETQFQVGMKWLYPPWPLHRLTLKE